MEVRLIRVRTWTAMFALVAASCATRPAPDFGGAWQAVNRYEATARPLPLQPVHRFHALPTDRSLRGLLVRWAHESRRRLSYRYADDFTLHAAVAGVHADGIEAAAAQLAQAYAAHGIGIRVTSHEIVVGAVSDPGSSAPVGVAGRVEPKPKPKPPHPSATGS